MKRILSFVIVILILNMSYGQDTTSVPKPWKTGAQFALTFSQTSLTNWSAGGENAIAFNSYINWFGNYSKGKHIWDNRINLAYGSSKQGKQDFRKNDDKIDISSMYGLQATKAWYYSALFNFKSQFAEGYDYLEDTTILLSKFLAPAYTSIGVGMSWKPKDFFSFYLSPVTARWIIVNDQELSDRGAFGVEPGEKIKSEFGALLRTEFTKDVSKNINLQTVLELFSDYLNNPQNIDVFWDFFATFSINNWLAVTLNTTLVYDNDVNIIDKDGNVGPRTQFKEVFGIGLSYNVGATIE